MNNDEQDPRELYEAVATENDPAEVQALAKDVNEAIEAEEREKKLALTAVRRTYIVRKRAS